MASVVFGLALGVVGLFGGSSVVADQPSAQPQVLTKLFICHATGNEAGPYVMIEVAYSAVNGTNADGAGDHLLTHIGPVWYPGAKADGVTWGDIIPPLAGVTVGLNWPEGEEIFNEDCVVPADYVPAGNVPADNLPTTGRDTSVLLLVGGVFVALGAMLFGLTRRIGIHY